VPGENQSIQNPLTFDQELVGLAAPSARSLLSRAGAVPIKRLKKLGRLLIGAMPEKPLCHVCTLGALRAGAIPSKTYATY